MSFYNVFDDESVWFPDNFSLWVSACLNASYNWPCSWNFIWAYHCIFVRVRSKKFYSILNMKTNKTLFSKCHIRIPADHNTLNWQVQIFLSNLDWGFDLGQTFHMFDIKAMYSKLIGQLIWSKYHYLFNLRIFLFQI